MAKVELGVVKLIQKGRHYALDLNEQQKSICQNLFSLCAKKHNYYVRVKFSTPARARSTGYKSQNTHLNGHCQQIAEDTGNDFALVKLCVKEKAIDMGYPMLYDDNGNPKVGMHGIRLAQSESDASTVECKILIEAAHLIAAEYGVNLIEE